MLLARSCAPPSTKYTVSFFLSNRFTIASSRFLRFGLDVDLAVLNRIGPLETLRFRRQHPKLLGNHELPRSTQFQLSQFLRRFALQPNHGFQDDDVGGGKSFYMNPFDASQKLALRCLDSLHYCQMLGVRRLQRLAGQSRVGREVFFRDVMSVANVNNVRLAGRNHFRHACGVAGIDLRDEKKQDCHHLRHCRFPIGRQKGMDPTIQASDFPFHVALSQLAERLRSPYSQRR